MIKPCEDNQLYPKMLPISCVLVLKKGWQGASLAEPQNYRSAKA